MEQLMLAERFRPANTTAERRKLLKVFHPDSGTHAAKKQLDEAAQIFTAIKFKFLD